MLAGMSGGRRVILWDVGGTLVDYACSLPEAVRRRLSHCGVDHSCLSDERIERTYAQFTSRDREWRTIADERVAEVRWMEELLENAGLNAAGTERVARGMPRYFEFYRPVTGIVDLLGELRERGLAMGVVSNWPPSLPELLAHHGLSRFFEVIVYSGEDGVHKPEAGIFYRALAAMRARADEAVFVGDDLCADIEGARAIGMTAIHFDPRKRSETRDADEITGLRRLLWGTF
jgi:putative hydrolase of the HAD superfamily